MRRDRLSQNVLRPPLPLGKTSSLVVESLRDSSPLGGSYVLSKIHDDAFRGVRAVTAVCAYRRARRAQHHGAAASATTYLATRSPLGLHVLR
jgi:hypothetical protein